MTALTPELRAFVEAVRWEARAAFTTEDGEAEAASQEVVRAADALLSADAGREQTAEPDEWPHPLQGSARSRVLVALGVTTVDEALAEIERLRRFEPPEDHEDARRKQPDAGAAGEAQPDKALAFPDGWNAPAPARRDEELDRWLDLFVQYGVTSEADEPGSEQKYREMREAIHALFARRVAEAEGVTVGEGEVISIWPHLDSVEVRIGATALVGIAAGQRVRLVRDAKEGEQ